MRGIFTIFSLLVTLAIVGLVVKKQLAGDSMASPATPGVASPSKSPADIQLQFKQALDAAVQPVKRDADER